MYSACGFISKHLEQKQDVIVFWVVLSTVTLIGLKIIKVRLGKVVKLALGTKKTQRGKRITGV